MAETLIELKKIAKCYGRGQESNYAVLKNINLQIQAGQLMAVLGPSGSGKSTLLRIIAGLSHATEGNVNYLGKNFCGVNTSASMVHKSVDLFPWLTVLENIKAGLINTKSNRNEKTTKTLEMIRMLGLEGFENAYPREITDGMGQRVAIGRALVSQPEVLLLDEPFSSLDLTMAESLRKDILSLWLEKKIGTRAIVIASKSVEDAVYLSDKIFILGNSLSKDTKEIQVDLPHWRDRKGVDFLSVVDQIHALMKSESATEFGGIDLMDTMQLTKLPNIAIDKMANFLAMQEDPKGKINIYKMTKDSMVDTREFFSMVDMAALLGFGQVQEGNILLTEAGKKLIKATTVEGKEVFGEQLLRYVPMIKQMLRYLESSSNKKINAGIFEDILKGYFTQEQTREQLAILIRWGLHAELFSYDEENNQLYIAQKE